MTERTNGSLPQPTEIPKHIAVIMDGNGRWAKSRGLARLEGHIAGAQSVRTLVEECRKLGVRYLTLFSFSTENWHRSPQEVSGLMSLFQQYLQSELEPLCKNGIRLRAIGDLQRLPDEVRACLEKTVQATREQKGMDLVLAVSYGAREEIVHAARNIAEKVARSELKVSEINEETFSASLWTADIPDPDLLIRSSGEMRISNFLLWQMAYAEIVVVPEYWPDFSSETFHRALLEFSRRERRFGLTTEQVRERKNQVNAGPRMPISFEMSEHKVK